MGQAAPGDEELACVHAITRVLHLCARALDRRDASLLRACFHADATDEHAPFFRGSADAFVAWVIPALSGMLATRHAITNIVVERHGDTAEVESLWHAMLRVREGAEIRVISRAGRYLDRFARIDGLWAITHRQSVTEWNRIETEREPDLAPAAIPRQT